MWIWISTKFFMEKLYLPMAYSETKGTLRSLWISIFGI